MVDAWGGGVEDGVSRGVLDEMRGKRDRAKCVDITAEEHRNEDTPLHSMPGLPVLCP